MMQLKIMTTTHSDLLMGINFKSQALADNITIIAAVVF